MLLKSLRMQNFRQYRGEQTVCFSTDPDKNVTVILGNNTFGKTTLLQAFNWCFYGKVLLPHPDELLNYDVVASMHNGDREEVVVEIELIHNGRTYTLTRSRTYEKVGASLRSSEPVKRLSYTKEDGQTEPVRAVQIDNVIKSILPEDLSSYFFFDTERVSNVSSRRDLGDAVKGLLGLSVLENAIKHLGSKATRRSVLGKLYLDLDEDGDSRASDALAHIQDAKDRITAIGEQLDQCKAEIATLTERKAQLDELLRDNGKSKTLQAEKERKETEVRRDTESLERTAAALRNDFRNASMPFFIRPLIGQAEALIAEARLDDKGVRDLTRPTLEEILERGVCVCGLKFSEHPDAVDHIKEEMRYCPPESIGNSVRLYREELKRRCADLETLFQGIHDRRCNIFATRERIQLTHDEIDNLSESIARLPNLGRYESARNDVKRQLRELNDRRESLIRQDESARNEMTRYQAVYDRTSGASTRNKKTLGYIAYAEEIASWLKNSYDEKQEGIREALLERVNSIFEQMYHGTRRVVIDANYQVHLLTDLNDTSRDTGESEGLNRVKNFAFIAGLVSLAKEKVVSDTGGGDFDLSSEPYPLVMDAPFSNADDEHIARISRVLPEASEQVIMFVMAKDWQFAEPVLHARIGSRYELDKQSEQYSILRSL